MNQTINPESRQKIVSRRAKLMRRSTRAQQLAATLNGTFDPETRMRFVVIPIAPGHFESLVNQSQFFGEDPLVHVSRSLAIVVKEYMERRFGVDIAARAGVQLGVPVIEGEPTK